MRDFEAISEKKLPESFEKLSQLSGGLEKNKKQFLKVRQQVEDVRGKYARNKSDFVLNGKLRNAASFISLGEGYASLTRTISGPASFLLPTDPQPAPLQDAPANDKLAHLHLGARDAQTLARSNNQLIFQQDEKLDQLNSKHGKAFDHLKASNRDLHERSVSHQASKKWQVAVFVAVLVAAALGAVAYFALC